MTDAERHLGRRTGTEVQHEQWQDRDLRYRVEQQQDRKKCLIGESAHRYGEPKHKPDCDRQHEADDKYPCRRLQRLEHIRLGEYLHAGRHDLAKRAEEQLTPVPARNFPDYQKEQDHEGAQHPGTRKFAGPRNHERPLRISRNDKAVFINTATRMTKTM